VWVWGDSSKTWTDSEGNQRPCGETGKPWYFLEEKYPAYGNLVPRDIATREIFQVVYELKMGLEGRPFVHLDVSHIAREKGIEFLDRKLKGILEIYEKFKGVDPHAVPMEIFPAVHYSMGGLWVEDDTHMTNIPGIFAAGECDYQFHGANRLGANSLLSCVYTGLYVSGPKALEFARRREHPASSVSESVFRAAEQREKDFLNSLLSMDGDENVHQLHREMGEMMTANVTIVRYVEDLKETDAKLKELQERFWRARLTDRGDWANQTLRYAHQVHHMMHLARVITTSAYSRLESRGSHYLPEHPHRNDEEWLKSTIATYDPVTGDPQISYEPVDLSLIPPRKRDYTKKSVAVATAK
jgi:succinate dehydrogenase / fumarate reductase flavoprotein subunit